MLKDRRAELDAAEAKLRQQLAALETEAERRAHVRRVIAAQHKRLQDLDQRATRLRVIGRRLKHIEGRMDKHPSLKELKRLNRMAHKTWRDVEQVHRQSGSGAVSYYRPGRTRLCKLLILTLLIGCFAEFFGLPAMRISYRYRGASSDPTIISARYLTMTGVREVGVYEMGDYMPLITLMPLDQSVLAYGRDAARWLWNTVTDANEQSERISP